MTMVRFLQCHRSRGIVIWELAHGKGPTNKKEGKAGNWKSGKGDRKGENPCSSSFLVSPFAIFPPQKDGSERAAGHAIRGIPEPLLSSNLLPFFFFFPSYLCYSCYSWAPSAYLSSTLRTEPRGIRVVGSSTVRVGGAGEAPSCSKRSPTAASPIAEKDWATVVSGGDR